MSGPELPQPGPAEHLQKKEGTDLYSHIVLHFNPQKFLFKYSLSSTGANLNR